MGPLASRDHRYHRETTKTIGIVGTTIISRTIELNGDNRFKETYSEDGDNITRNGRPARELITDKFKC